VHRPHYAASLAVLSEHSVALLVFLLAVSLAGSILAHATRSSIVRAVFWAAAIVPLFGWIHQHAGSAWLMPDSSRWRLSTRSRCCRGSWR
jgi:hypothetical protein